MSQVSKRKVHEKIEFKIFETFWQAFTHLKSRAHAQLFLDDILYPTEKIMVAKRLAIASLLLKNYDYESIKNILKVSQGTVSKVALTLKFNKGYTTIINKIQRSEVVKEFWQTIERIGHRFITKQYQTAPDEVLKKKLGHQKKTLVR